MNLINYYYAGIVVVILFVLFLAYKGLFGAKFKKQSIDFMTKAQYSKLGRNALVETISKFRKGTMDERMVLVLANVIERIPIINLVYVILPKSLFINILYNQEQAIFDMIEKPLKSGETYTFPEMELKAEPLKESELSQLTEAVKEFNEVLPTVKELKPLMENLPMLVEIAKLASKESSNKDVIKDGVVEKELVSKINTDNMTITPSEDLNSVNVVTKVDKDFLKPHVDSEENNKEEN